MGLAAALKEEQEQTEQLRERGGHASCSDAAGSGSQAFTPFITDQERRHAGCQHRLFFSQVEYCDNLSFHRLAAVDELTGRLLDLKISTCPIR